MTQLKNIEKKKLEWEQYYDPDFDWGDWEFYANNTLTEDFIREFRDKVYWLWISYFQSLSESFLREFENEVHWELVLIYQNQKLSKKFIREFTNKYKDKYK